MIGGSLLLLKAQLYPRSWFRDYSCAFGKKRYGKSAAAASKPVLRLQLCFRQRKRREKRNCNLEAVFEVTAVIFAKKKKIANLNFGRDVGAGAAAAMFKSLLLLKAQLQPFPKSFRDQLNFGASVLAAKAQTALLLERRACFLLKIWNIN